MPTIHTADIPACSWLDGALLPLVLRKQHLLHCEWANACGALKGMVRTTQHICAIVRLELLSKFVFAILVGVFFNVWINKNTTYFKLLMRSMWSMYMWTFRRAKANDLVSDITQVAKQSWYCLKNKRTSAPGMSNLYPGKVQS